MMALCLSTALKSYRWREETTYRLFKINLIINLKTAKALV